MQPAASVIITSDYAGGEDKSWNDLRVTLKALAEQDFQERAEFVLVESAAYEDGIPADLTAILPALKVIFSPGTTSYDLKNEGARAASADIVVMLDADCAPERDWLRHLVDTLHAYPDAAVVSGRTVYPGPGMVQRILALLGRSYVERGRTAPTPYISNNNAGFRREVLLAQPMPDAIGPFGARLHSETLKRQGHRLMFEPRATVVHDFDGWAMERDIRRHQGYEAIAVRRIDRRIRCGWLADLGYLAIPLITVSRTGLGWWRCLRYGRCYGVSFYEIPAALCMTVVVQIMEIQGMIAAIRGRAIKSTAYR